MSAKEKFTVWKYFKRISPEKAKCLKCVNTVLSCKGSSTSGLIRHLAGVHKIYKDGDGPASKSPSSKSPPSKQQRISESPLMKALQKDQKPSLEEVVSRMAAVDGFSFNQINTSDFIQHSLKKDGYKVSKDKNFARDCVSVFYAKAKKKTIAKLEVRIGKHERFSVSLDEYTSTRNRRYANVNVHTYDKKRTCLGMVRIIGSLCAEGTVSLVKKRLFDFGICFSVHVFGGVTDGASLMIKFHRISPTEGQLCFAHGIHLAVCDVMYVKKKKGRLITLVILLKLFKYF